MRAVLFWSFCSWSARVFEQLPHTRLQYSNYGTTIDRYTALNVSRGHRWEVQFYRAYRSHSELLLEYEISDYPLTETPQYVHRVICGSFLSYGFTIMLRVMSLDATMLRLDPAVIQLVFEVLQLSLLVASHFSMASRSHFGFAGFNVTAGSHTGYSYIGLIRKHTRNRKLKAIGKVIY